MFPEEGFRHVICYNLENVPRILIDNRISITHFDRVAYHIELLSTKYGYQYLWSSFDPFNDQTMNIGVPEENIFETPVYNMHINSNIFGMYQGNVQGDCHLKFSPYAYKPSNPLTNEDDLEQSIGCMQLFHKNKCIFAYNNFRNPNKASDLGLGNCTEHHRDWTACRNSEGYQIARLNVYARPSLASMLIAESKIFNMRYSLDIPIFQKQLLYALDSHRYNDSNKPFDRVGYLMNLEHFNGFREYIWISMDAFTSNMGEITVPKGATVQKIVTNISVTSNKLNMENVHIPQGLLEFSPYNYAPGSSNIFGIKDSLFGEGTYGCFQVHANGHTLFAYNSHKGIPDIGIGNSDNGYNDWTFAQNGHLYKTRKLEIFTRNCRACEYEEESHTMRLLTNFNIPATGRPHMFVSNKLSRGSFNRVGIFTELASFKDGINWMWVSFNVTDPVSFKYCLPDFNTGTVQEKVSDVIVKVYSNGHFAMTQYEDAVFEATPYDYFPTQHGSFKQVLDSGQYGCFQLHTDEGYILSYNNHNGVGDIGFGTNATGIGQVDWSFSNNAPSFSSRYMEIFVNNTTYVPDVVFLVTGQSNSQGWGGLYEPFNPEDESDNRIFGWNMEENAWVIFDLEKPIGTKPIGLQCFAFHFAKQYLKAFPDKKIGFVVNGLGGQAICRWTKPHGVSVPSVDMHKEDVGDLYDDSVHCVNMALKNAGVDKIDGVLWHQGEADYLESYEYYTERLEKVISQYREEPFGHKDLAFIAGELIHNSDEWAYNKQNFVLQTLNDNEDKFVRCASTKHLPANGDDLVHFATESHRMMGRLYYDQYKIISLFRD